MVRFPSNSTSVTTMICCLAQDDSRFGGRMKCRRSGLAPSGPISTKTAPSGLRQNARRRRRGLRFRCLAFDELQPDRERVRANLAPIPRLAAGAEIFEIGLALHTKAGADRAIPLAHTPGEKWWCVIRLDNAPCFLQLLRLLHRGPAPRFHQKFLRKGNGRFLHARHCGFKPECAMDAGNGWSSRVYGRRLCKPSQPGYKPGLRNSPCRRDLAAQRAFRKQRDADVTCLPRESRICLRSRPRRDPR